MKKFSSWFSGSQPGKQQRPTPGGRPKKNVHWKSAERPSPPGRPILIPLSDQQPDVVTLKWERPKLDGGSPITGYIIEHRRMGSPHWVRSTPALVVTCEVAISGLEPGWRYQFRAIAENIVGRSDPSELSDPLTVTLQRNAISVPRFVKELADLSVVENERVEFRVTILGQPPPEISWFKDGYEIFSSRRTKIVNDNDVSVLIIHQVALTDEGEIKCTATNRAGHVVTKAKLMVEAPPKIRLPRNYEDGLIVEADEVLRLKVGIAGQPPPSVVWLHEGEPIPNTGRHELVTSDKNSSLKIENVKRVDRGEYTIRATNKLGEDTTSFLVTVTSRPHPPGKVRLNTSYGKSATLSWTAPEDDGGCKIGSYIVEYFRIGWNVWLKAATTRQLSTTLNDLIEGSEYKFRVKAENPYGLSDPGEESDVLFIPDPKRGKDENGKDKPIPPRRKTLSPQRAMDEERSGDKSPNQHSPMLDRKTKPQILDNEDLHREMSYGTNLSETRRTSPSTSQMDVQSGSGAIKRSPSPRNPVVETKKKVASVSTSTSRPVLSPLTLPPKPPTPAPSILPIRPVSSPKTPPAIAPALGPVLTSAIAPVLRFAPTTPTQATPAPLPTPATPTKLSTPPAPAPATPPTRQSPPQKASPEPRPSLIPKTNANRNGAAAQPKEPSPRRTVEPRVPAKEPATVARNRSLSPVEPPVRQAPPETPPHLRKTSKALQRSEEPADLNANQRLSSFSERRLSPDQERRASYNGGAPKIHISAPSNEPAPLSDADKRDEVHTSNEFMLVLFHKNSKVKDKEKQDSFDLDLEEALQPPPISISSPDLASLEFSNLHTFPLRRSVSSTELLYERAMARFYEAVEMEEAEKAKKLKLSQEKLPGQPVTVRKRLGSMSEAERLSFEKRSLRRRSTDIGDLISSSNPKWDSKDNVSRPLSRNRNLMDDSFRQESQDTDDVSDYHGKPGDSFDVESDYTASTESVSEDSIEKFKRELVARTRSTSDELETYHPRSMTGGVFTPYRAPTPEQSVIVLNRPMPMASPDFVPKPILKRPSKENVLRDGSLSPTNGPSSPTTPGSPAVPSSPTEPNPPTFPIEPIFPISPPTPEPAPQPSPPPAPASPTMPPTEKPDKGKGFKSFFKWDKKPPVEKPAEPEPAVDKAAADAEAKRKAKEEEDRKKLEAERIFEEEAKVVVDHYSDLVRQVGTTRKYNPPLYLNREELKKAAEKAAQESLLDDDIEDFNPSSEHYERLHKPRLSLVERHQIQHVKDTSRLAMTVNEKSKIPETPSEEDATPSSASQPSQRSESRGRTKIVKVKKIVRKRVPSGTRSREQSSSRPPSSLGASSEDFARRPASRTRFVPEPPAKRELPPSPQPPTQPPPSTALVAVPQKSAEELTQEAEEKVRSAISYMTDVCLFIAACYVYLFKDARLVLPILALMVYRQLGEVLRNIIPDWMRRKRQ